MSCLSFQGVSDWFPQEEKREEESSRGGDKAEVEGGTEESQGRCKLTINRKGCFVELCFMNIKNTKPLNLISPSPQRHKEYLKMLQERHEALGKFKFTVTNPINW